jgi:hypothetical protein
LSKLKIEFIEGEHEVEVLAINGGREEVLGTLTADGDTSVVVEVAAPAAVVLRELPTVREPAE